MGVDRFYEDQESAIRRNSVEKLIGLTLCLRSGPAPWGDERAADRGCGEDLTERILSSWNGTDESFTVECDCGRRYEYTITVVAEAERKDL